MLPKVEWPKQLNRDAARIERRINSIVLYGGLAIMVFGSIITAFLSFLARENAFLLLIVLLVGIPTTAFIWNKFPEYMHSLERIKMRELLPSGVIKVK